MVEFKTKVDRLGKIYIPKVLREQGFNNGIKILANFEAILLYPSDAELKRVVKSVQILLEELIVRCGEKNGK